MTNIESVLNFSGTPKPAHDPAAWAEKKQAERNEVYALIDSTAQAMLENSQLFQSGLNIIARFDRYSVGNVLLIAAQCPEATKLADFATWKKSGVYIRNGEDHIKVLEPGKEYQRTDGSVGVRYNVKHVFDISQTTARPRPLQSKQDLRLLLKAMLHNAPCPVEICDSVPNGVNAFYDHSKKVIFIRQGMDSADIFRCLAQELAHAHLDTGDGYDRKRSSFTAYCTAYTLCQRYGIGTDCFDFSPVCKELGGMDQQVLRNELTSIRTCTNRISMDMFQVLEHYRQERSEESR